MLKNTFMHIPGVGRITERRLWESGVLCWDDFFGNASIRQTSKRKAFMENHLEASQVHFQQNNLQYFFDQLPANQHWRLFPDFRESVAYLDIETTGLQGWQDEITTIALYDGKNIFTYVNGRNLDDFNDDIAKYRAVITYNGKCFDLPFIENYLGISLNPIHVDLRYILAGLGYKGGLKSCERQLGIDRNDLADIDGYFAVLLWNEYKRNHNQKALETLLAYNIQDVVNLEALMVESYNINLRDTPFYGDRQLTCPKQPEISFKANRKVVEKIKMKGFGGAETYYR